MLFSPQHIELPDGRLSQYWNVLPAELASKFTQHLMTNIAWHHEVYRGKATRRGTAWFADQGIEYRYSGQSMAGTGWDPQVDQVRQLVQETCDATFNSVLVNFYPDGLAAMGWHSDDEPELGPNPTIASLSLGASRTFKLKHKTKDDKYQCTLEHNSLLVMAGELQHHWQHTLPRRTAKVGERLNLTFRYTIPDYWTSSP